MPYPFLRSSMEKSLDSMKIEKKTARPRNGERSVG